MTRLFMFAASFVTVLPGLAFAGDVPVAVPEPGTLGLLTVGAAAVAIGARWIRRK